MTSVSNRSELLDKARHFLTSHQVIHQDHESKRRFLTDKGLTDGEIQLLLREMVRRVVSSAQSFTQVVLSSQALATPTRAAPHVPRPTSVPPARPSCGHLQAAFVDHRGLHSPALHLLRASAPSSPSHSLTGPSLQRFLLPRLTQSALARRSLKAHQSDLFTKLTESLRDLRDEQTVAYADLPRPDPWEEPADPWGECKDLRDIVAAVAAQPEHQPRATVPHVTLLRCALADLAVQGKPSTADEIFHALFATELPSLLAIDDAYQVRAVGPTSRSHFLINLLGVAVENAQRCAAFPSRGAWFPLRAT